MIDDGEELVGFVTGNTNEGVGGSVDENPNDPTPVVSEDGSDNIDT